jgi:hypothetical protein
VKRILASEPIIGILGAVGTAVGVYMWNVLPADLRPVILGVLGPLVLAGGAARAATVAPDTFAAGVTEAARRPIQESGGVDTGPENIVPRTLEPVVNSVARDVAGKAGGLAGSLAEDAVNRIVGGASGMASRRLTKLFRR